MIRQRNALIALACAAAVTACTTKPAEKASAPRTPLFDNLWSLSGLATSLERQGHKNEAAAAQARFDQGWRNADTVVSAARPGGARRGATPSAGQ